jgi:hypothetical protein
MHCGRPLGDNHPFQYDMYTLSASDEPYPIKGSELLEKPQVKAFLAAQPALKTKFKLALRSDGRVSPKARRINAACPGGSANALPRQHVNAAYLYGCV